MDAAWHACVAKKCYFLKYPGHNNNNAIKTWCFLPHFGNGNLIEMVRFLETSHIPMLPVNFHAPKCRGKHHGCFDGIIIMDRIHHEIISLPSLTIGGRQDVKKYTKWRAKISIMCDWHALHSMESFFNVQIVIHVLIYCAFFWLLVWQVSTNGLLSFEGPYQSFEPCHFPCTPEPVITPLWTDLDFSSRGLIYYRASQDPDILTQVVDMITAVNPGLSEYQPKLALVVTWFDATPRKNESVCLLYSTYKSMLLRIN